MFAVILALIAAAGIAFFAGDKFGSQRTQRPTTVTQGFGYGDTLWPGAAKVIEESGELLQVLGKLMMTHGEPQHWSGDLVPKLNEEIADLVAATETFITLNIDRLDKPGMIVRAKEKIETFMGWHKERLAND